MKVHNSMNSQQYTHSGGKVFDVLHSTMHKHTLNILPPNPTLEVYLKPSTLYLKDTLIPTS